jgi:hypothetical protein
MSGRYAQAGLYETLGFLSPPLLLKLSRLSVQPRNEASHVSTRLLGEWILLGFGSLALACCSRQRTGSA